ncbi:hypothetical protein C8J57DRAFT_97939 [Mycena rebaudengoi]|nr:hypothetical protein C8J57DRAFT_97939 [Mycena rebaudengoi]
MSWGSLSTPDNNSGFSNGDRSPHGQLSPGWRYPMQQQPAPYSESLPSQQPPPPSPSLLTVPPSGAALQRRGASRRTRSHSDLNSLAPPDLDAASNARRTNVATFECHFPNCTSTFTARHNLMNHINSHNKCRPHACLCGLSFTTQGVLNRHKKRCRKTSS